MGGIREFGTKLRFFPMNTSTIFAERSVTGGTPLLLPINVLAVAIQFFNQAAVADTLFGIGTSSTDPLGTGAIIVPQFGASEIYPLEPSNHPVLYADHDGGAVAESMHFCLWLP